MEGVFSQIQSHTIAITANGRLNHSTYFTIASNGSAINPGHFGPIQGNSVVLLVLNLICRSRDMHRLFTITIAITANGRLNHSTYFTIASNGSAINPGHFGPIQGNSVVLLVLNLICRSRDIHRLFTIISYCGYILHIAALCICSLPTTYP